MMRSWTGGGVMVIAFLGILVGANLLGPDEPGMATRAAPPAPPPIGTCINGFLDPVVVACDQPHTGEISLSWTGDDLPDVEDYLDPSVSLPYAPEGAASDPLGACWLATASYLGDTPSTTSPAGVDWRAPTITASSDLIQGPAESTIPDWSWTACLTTPSAAGPFNTLIGSFRGFNSDPTRLLPTALRSCTGTTAQVGAPAPCSEPHRSELVAYGLLTSPDRRLDLEPGDGYTDPAVLDECSERASVYLGDPLADRAPALTAEVLVLTVEPSTTDDSTYFGVSCSLTVGDGSMLIDSVAGLGTGPLPLG